LPSNPSYKKVNPADAPILMLAMTSDLVERARMYDIASSVLQQKLSQMQGVGEIRRWRRLTRGSGGRKSHGLKPLRA